MSTFSSRRLTASWRRAGSMDLESPAALVAQLFPNLPAEHVEAVVKLLEVSRGQAVFAFADRLAKCKAPEEAMRVAGLIAEIGKVGSK